MLVSFALLLGGAAMDNPWLVIVGCIGILYLITLEK